MVSSGLPLNQSCLNCPLCQPSSHLCSHKFRSYSEQARTNTGGGLVVPYIQNLSVLPPVSTSDILSMNGQTFVLYGSVVLTALCTGLSSMYSAVLRSVTCLQLCLCSTSVQYEYLLCQCSKSLPCVMLTALLCVCLQSYIIVLLIYYFGE